jgi:hypothetical protein
MTLTGTSDLWKRALEEEAITSTMFIPMRPTLCTISRRG